MRPCSTHWAACFFLFIVTVSVQCQVHGSPAQCSVAYGTGLRQPSLLFGGVFSTCEAGCQPRNDAWSETCNPKNTKNTPMTNTCQLFQTPGIISVLQQLEGDGLSRFSPCELHQRLKGRTLWVIGDSMMRFIYQALRCFMLDFWDHSLGECAATPNQALLKELYQAADTNHTSVMGHQANTDMPGCVYLLAGGRICWISSVRGEEFAASRPGESSLLQLLHDKLASKDDIFFISFGRWHFNNCAGLQRSTYRRSLRQLATFYERTRTQFPNLVYRVTAHDHTPCPRKKEPVWAPEPTLPTYHASNGSSTASSDTSDLPLQVTVRQAHGKKKSARFGAECLPAHQGNYSLRIGNTVQSEAQKLLADAGVPVIDNYSMTRQLYKAHIFMEGVGWDCNHWCSPGVPEWEIYTLFKAFKQYNIQPLPPAAVSRAQPKCVPVVIQGPPPEGWVVRPAETGSSGDSASGAAVGVAAALQKQEQGSIMNDY